MIFADESEDELEEPGVPWYMPSVQQMETEAKKRLNKKIDKMFEVPLVASICMLALAHGSNEINVSAPLAAEFFLLNGKETAIEN